MRLSGRITPDSLMTLEAYSLWRTAHRPAVMQHRRQRSVPLGAHLNLQFEDELTVRYQIQEMLRIEKVFEAVGIAHEVQAYAPLVPDGSNWKATLLIEYPDPQERRQALARLIGVEDRLYVAVNGQAPVYAVADEDLARESAHKTSAVHFLRFEFSPVQRAAILGGARVSLGCDHPQHPAQVDIPAGTLALLAGDLR